jgi:hypothetical protein
VTSDAATKGRSAFAQATKILPSECDELFTWFRGQANNSRLLRNLTKVTLVKPALRNLNA